MAAKVRRDNHRVHDQSSNHPPVLGTGDGTKLSGAVGTPEGQDVPRVISTSWKGEAV